MTTLAPPEPQLLAADHSRRLTATGTIYTRPGETGSLVPLKTRYDNFIGGEWVKPTKGTYSEDVAPATGKAFAEFASSSVEDIDLAVAAAKAAFPAWSKTSVADRAAVLNRIADRLAVPRFRRLQRH